MLTVDFSLISIHVLSSMMFRVVKYKPSGVAHTLDRRYAWKDCVISLRNSLSICCTSDLSLVSLYILSSMFRVVRYKPSGVAHTRDGRYAWKGYVISLRNSYRPGLQDVQTTDLSLISVYFMSRPKLISRSGTLYTVFCRGSGGKERVFVSHTLVVLVTIILLL